MQRFHYILHGAVIRQLNFVRPLVLILQIFEYRFFLFIGNKCLSDCGHLLQ